MSLRSMPPWWNASFENDRATEATSGKIERTRIRRTAGQMKSHLAAPSERQASSVSVARRRAAERRSRSADPARTGSPGSSFNELSLDAKAGDVGSELLVPSDLVGDGIPPVRDGLLGAGGIELLGKVLRHGGVEDVLLVALRQRDPQVEDHVRVGQAGLDRPEIVFGGGLAETRVEPRLDVVEVGRPIGVVAGLAQGHVDARDRR